MGRLKWPLLSVVVVYVLLEALLLGYRSVSRRSRRSVPRKADAVRTVPEPPAEKADILFEETLCINVDLSEPRDLAACDDGRIVVVGDSRVLTLDAEGAVAETITVEEAPLAVAVDSLTNVYVGMKTHVEVYPGGSTDRRVWAGPSDRSHFTSMTVGPTGVFVADYGCREVWHFDLAGGLLGSLGAGDESKRRQAFILPTPHFDVLASDGSVWVSNPGRRRIEEFAPDGHRISHWGEASARIDGFCGRANPSHFARLPDGRFVTSEKGRRRVKVYSATGRFLGLVAPMETFGQGDAGPALAVDRWGRVLVLDPRSRELRIYVEKANAPPN